MCVCVCVCVCMCVYVRIYISLESPACLATLRSYTTKQSVDDNIYASLLAVGHSGEGINSCHPRNAKLF